MAKITIIGTGLIGTSIALGLKAAKINNLEIVGTDYNRSVRGKAKKTGAFDKIESHLIPSVLNANIVMLAVPVMAMEETMRNIAPELSEGCIVTDVGSSKKIISQWASEILPDYVDYVGGHPMAGKEKHGPESADANLFTDKVYCIIPGPNAKKTSVEQISKLATAVNATPYFISLDEHDSYVAAVSHLPFVLSSILMKCTSNSENWFDMSNLAASGYRDITRLASGDPMMHKDISVSNASHISYWIDTFITDLQDFKKMLETTDSDIPLEEPLLNFFTEAGNARGAWIAGASNLKSRNFDHNKEIPSFSDGIGEMFMGKRLMDARKRMFNHWNERDEQNEKR